MTSYAKGEAPRNLDAACGGPTLGRVRDFVKTQDQMLGPPNKQDYASKGAPAKRTGDKSCPPVKPRS